MSGETEKQVSGWTVDTLKEHLEDMIRAQAELQKAKWESQDATNKSANEWRGTIGDLKRDFVPRSEYSTLETRFAADQLQTARALSQTGGEKLGASETKRASMAQLSLAVAAASALATFVASILVGVLRGSGHA